MPEREREASFWGEEAGWTRKFLAKLWVCDLGNSGLQVGFEEEEGAEWSERVAAI